MPEVQEVFRMATQKVRPEPGALDRQLGQQRRRSRNRRNGAIALVAVLGVVGVAFAIQLAGQEDRSQPATRPKDTPPELLPYMLDLETGAVTPLPQELYGGWSFQVSPDRSMFAYGLCCLGERIPGFLATLDGSVRRKISPAGMDALGPSWSPDGSQIVYQVRPSGTQLIGDLFIQDVATRAVRQITDFRRQQIGDILRGEGAWWYLGPMFSPDGTEVIFQSPRGPNETPTSDTRWDLWAVPLEGGEPTLVLRDAAFGSYSPDGGTIAYLDAPRASDGGGWSSSIWLADADGSDARLLVEGEYDFLRWSPNGTRIVYAGDGQIYVVDVATGVASYVADGDTAEWFDDNTLVIAQPGPATAF